MDKEYWHQLADLDPANVCRRSGAVLDGDGYRLRVLGSEYLIVPGEQRITRPGTGGNCQSAPAVSGNLELVIVHYLIAAKGLPVTGEWVGLQDLGSGSRFFTSPAHVPDFGDLLPLCATSAGAVVRAARSLGGRRLEGGDLAVEIRVLPRLPLALVCWNASDEFPARASVLCDRGAREQLPLDVLLAAIQEAIRQLGIAARGAQMTGNNHSREEVPTWKNA